MIFKDVMDWTGLSLVGLRVVMGAIVAISAVLFVHTQRKADEPILPLRFFANRNFSLVMGIATLFGAGFMGSILYLTQFNQQVFGASPTESGLMLLPMVGGLMLASIGSGQLISRIGRYKIFMQVGIVIATCMVALLTTLTPESPYYYEAILMSLVGFGLGFVMPVMNIAVQNEFEQKDLGVATSSIQLFRGLGSTIGIAIFGAVLTSGITANLTDMQNDAYLKSLASSPAVKQIGNLNDPNTQLTLNTPDIKQKISDGFTKSTASLPAPVKEKAQENFEKNQSEYSYKVTHAFSNALRDIFITSAILMGAAAILVFAIKERELAMATPDSTPGEE